MPSHGTYLRDGLYRCENKNCDTYRSGTNADGEKWESFGYFTGGGFRIDPDTNAQVVDENGVPVFFEGSCPNCEHDGVSVDPENLDKKAK